MRARLSILVATLLAVSLAGCASDEASGAGAEDGPARGADEALAVVETPDGYRLSRELTANDTLAAPVPWRVGDWFGVHVFFQDDDEGTHYNTIVVEETSDAWILATDNQQFAKFEAIFDVPILGPFAKGDLGTTGFGGEWNLLQFPLRDGTTWSSDIAFDVGVTQKLEFEARFEERIATPYGTFPGFLVQAVDAEATPVLAYDYVPEIGWFTQFAVLDTATDDPDDVVLTARSMGHGSNWKGTYFRDTAASLAQHFNGVILDPAAPQASPAPTASFAVSEEADYLVGFVFSIAFAGAHETVLVDPAQHVREFRAVDGVAYNEGVQQFIDEPAVPGEWRVVTAGAGVAAVGGVFLWSVMETQANL